MLHIEDMRIRRGSDYQIVLPRLILGRGEVAAITGASDREIREPILIDI